MTDDTMRNRALDLARRGFRVFPLRIGGKTPVHDEFYAIATADEAQVRRLWTDPFGAPEHWNIGLATGWTDDAGRMLVALDVDRKDGRDGLPLLRFLQDDLDLPADTLCTRTPSGGEHHVFLAPPGVHVANSQAKIGAGIDVRGWHGYIVAPGSVTERGEYVLQGAGLAAPVRELPAALARKMEGRPPAERPRAGAQAIGELDTQWALARAQVYLEEEAPEAYGDGRKGAAFQAAQRVGDLGVSEGECLALMEERWNGVRCEPPLEPDELAYRVRNAYAYRHDPVGVHAPPPPPELEFGAVQIAPLVPDGFALRACDILAQPLTPREWHVDGLIPLAQVTLLAGDGATGKSLLARQLAAATAAHRTWLGREVQPGPCLVLSAEDDIDEERRRLADICRADEIRPEALAALEIVPLAGKDAVLAALDWQKPGTVVATTLFRRVREKIAAMRPRLVVLDTRADLFAGNEVDRAQVRQFIGMLRGLAIDFHCAVVLLDHPSMSGMASGAGTAGSVAWSNSVRSRLYLRREKDAKTGDEKDPNLRILEVMKANYAARGEQTRIRWSAGRFVAEGAPVSAEEMAARYGAAQGVFLELLASDEYGQDRTGKCVHESIRAANYAPKKFASDPRAVEENLDEKHFESAMRALKAAGKIEMADFKFNGKPYRRLRVRA